MFTVDQANAFNYLQTRLRPRELSIARAFLDGNLPQAKALLAYDEAHYESPKDDIAAGLGGLLEYLRGCMKPADYSKAELMAYSPTGSNIPVGCPLSGVKQT